MAGVTTTHDDYDKMHGEWEKCRDFCDGARAVKEAGTHYLPKLGDQDDDEYEAYKTRAMFYAATKRTKQALSGMVFRKKPAVTLGDAEVDESLLRDVTQNGLSFFAFSKGAFEEVIEVGRAGILVDMSTGDNPVGTLPYFVLYKSEDILNWRVERIDNKMVLTMVVLKEVVDQIKPGSVFDSEQVTRYRVLLLEDGVYRVRVYTVTEGDDSEIDENSFEPIEPTRSGAPLDFIPFYFLGENGNVPDVLEPPMLDIVEINQSHYLSSADLEHGRHFTGLPTAWVAGFSADTELRIGSGRAWVTDNPQARAGFLEFTGAGLSTLENALTQKERLMALLGAKMLEGQRPGVEAAETVRLRQGGEASVLGMLANAGSDVLSAAMTTFLWWGGQINDRLAQPASVELNRDFMDWQIDGSEAVALFTLYQQGGIAYETFYYLLQKGEMVRPNTTADDERSAIENGGLPNVNRGEGGE